MYCLIADKCIIISDEVDAYLVSAWPDTLARGRSAVSGWIMPTKAQAHIYFPGSGAMIN